MFSVACGSIIMTATPGASPRQARSTGGVATWLRALLVTALCACSALDGQWVDGSGPQQLEDGPPPSKYLAVDFTYVGHDDPRFGNDGPAVMDPLTGMVFSARETWIPVSAAVASSTDFARVTPDRQRTPNVTVFFGVLVPARHGYWIHERDANNPQNMRSWAISHEGGENAVLVRITKAHAPNTVAVPYWASVETDGATGVDEQGHSYVSLEQGQYALFYSGATSPAIGPDHIAFLDRYPKEAHGAGDGVGGLYDFGTDAGSPVVGTIPLAFGYGPDLGDRLGGFGAAMWASPTAITWHNLAAGSVVQNARGGVNQPTGPTLQQNFGFSTDEFFNVYQADSGTLPGTFQEGGHFSGKIIVLQDLAAGSFGIARESAQCLSATNADPYAILLRYRRFRISEPEGPLRGSTRRTFGQLMHVERTVRNYDQSGITVSFAIGLYPSTSGFHPVTSYSYYNGSWQTSTVGGQGYHWFRPSWASRALMPTDHGLFHVSGKLTHAIRPSNKPAQLGESAFYGPVGHVNVLNLAGTDGMLSAGDVWGMIGQGVYSPDGFTDEDPPAPTDLASDTSLIDGYFENYD